MDAARRIDHEENQHACEFLPFSAGYADGESGSDGHTTDTRRNENGGTRDVPDGTQTGVLRDDSRERLHEEPHPEDINRKNRDKSERFVDDRRNNIGTPEQVGSTVGAGGTNDEKWRMMETGMQRDNHHRYQWRAGTNCYGESTH